MKILDVYETGLRDETARSDCSKWIYPSPPQIVSYTL